MSTEPRIHDINSLLLLNHEKSIIHSKPGITLLESE